MTTLVLTPRRTRHAFAAGFPALIARRVTRYLRIRRDRRLLQAMPDYLLADIGISRSEIDRATRYGRQL